jgi:zinc transport system ATP-binding protein
MTNSLPLITVANAAFSYNGTTVVADINFTLNSGGYLCVIGENGSGKSTLVKGLLGLKAPDAGQIVFANNLTRRQIGYLPQQNAISRDFPASVEEVVLSGRLGQGNVRLLTTKTDKRLAHAALEQLGVADLRRAVYGELSGGQQQRVLLARALSTASDTLKALILDEPMNGLDPTIKAELYSLIDELNRTSGVAIIMVTHDLQSALAHASHILLLERKQLFFGSAHDFEHTSAGQELLRDACGGHCAHCGIEVREAL